MFFEVMLTLLTLVGIFLYYNHEINQLYVSLKNKVYSKFLVWGDKESINRDVSFYEGSYYSHEGINSNIRRLVLVSIGLDSLKCVYAFWVISIFIPIMAGFILMKYIPMMMVYSFCTLLAFLPTILMIARVKALRIKNSKEGKVFPFWF